MIGRFLADGSLDPSFLNGTLGIYSFGSEVGANVLAVQQDGKIVVAGGKGGYWGPSLLFRCLPDGSVDGTFAGGLPVKQSTFDDEIVGLALQPDGKILVVGDFSLARLLP